ncbi:helix-turn-helix domain-containing protein, partial [Candidatus Woesearchaeota archaeon]|nr:helix-turn-helix domain-containing protein [Candidatus Woesearchaeota archaeon]
MKATVGTRDYKPKDLLTVHEVAPILRVAQKTVYRYLDEGTLPSVRFGGAVRVEYGALMAFISGKQPEQETNHATGTNNPAETPLGHNAPETLAYKVEEAAAMLHVEPENIMQAVENGQLYAVIVGKTTVIPKSELEQMVEAPARVDQFTRQLLIQKGMVSEGFPFDNPESYKK